MTEIDILEIHNQILTDFESNRQKIEYYKTQILDIDNSFEIDDLSHRIEKRLLIKKQELNDKISNIEKNKDYNYYVMETADIIEKYKKVLNSPIKMSFTGRKNTDNKYKKSLIEKYLKIVNNYIPEKIVINDSKIEKIVCKQCKSKNIEITDMYTICEDCGNELDNNQKFSSYKDIERVNIVAKYTYDRKIHFRDCINQFQGKQNSTINQSIYDNLIKQFELHSLLVGDKDTPPKKRFSRITRDHIYLFLKENGNSKHYEDVVLIHYNITKKKPDDISHLETKLLDDFDTLTQLYDKIYKKDKKIERKNFINTQYVLFQLLRRHKYPCKRTDFNILKTVDRKSFHDEVCKNMFSILGWNFTALF